MANISGPQPDVRYCPRYYVMCKMTAILLDSKRTCMHQHLQRVVKLGNSS